MGGVPAGYSSYDPVRNETRGSLCTVALSSSARLIIVLERSAPVTDVSSGKWRLSWKVAVPGPQPISSDVEGWV